MQIHELSLTFLLWPRLIPVDIHLRIPVELLTQLIQLFNAVVLNRVVPVIRAGQRRLKNLRDVIHICTGQHILELRVLTRIVRIRELLNFSGCLLTPFNLHCSHSLN